MQYPSLDSTIPHVSHLDYLLVRVAPIAEDLGYRRIYENNERNDLLFKGSCLPNQPTFDQCEIHHDMCTDLCAEIYH